MIKIENRNKWVAPGIEGTYEYEAQTLIEKLREKKLNREDIEKVHSGTYTEKKKGVLSAYNIRTDRFEIGQKRAEEIAAYRVAKEMWTKERLGTPTDEFTEKEKESTESQKVFIKPDQVDSH
ncbi:hypothetical protein [Dipodfec virus UOA04_Rod_663]|nr:hypothetical protein [Dipodfec virus UOA04_Rod_663]